MSSFDDDRRARAALTRVIEPDHAMRSAYLTMPPVELLNRIRSAGFEVEEWAARAVGVDPVRDLEVAARDGVRFVIPGDDEWPVGVESLRGLKDVSGQDLPGVPFGLWVRGGGSLRRGVARSVAVVGARACSSYGEYVASEFASGLAEMGWSTVSGGAYGIDAAAHMGTLAAGGTTVAVLACGADMSYPRRNEGLFDRIAEHGLIVSELPPGSAPTRRRFLMRNRLIAALAGGVVLVEAAERSGALITGKWASLCSRVLMAVPGPVTSRMSTGCHGVIRSGGVLVQGVRDVLDAVEDQQAGPAGVHS
ncbi:DNA-processing protein DprA [Kribbella sp. NPDC059898]|uniref:DNA-processing protein DprA n=1 Tax=Kribbella sp. NPDC059898 TaxID=3346995 RepID=UPI00364A9D0A